MATSQQTNRPLTRQRIHSETEKLAKLCGGLSVKDQGHPRLPRTKGTPLVRTPHGIKDGKGRTATPCSDDNNNIPVVSKPQLTVGKTYSSLQANSACERASKENVDSNDIIKHVIQPKFGISPTGKKTSNKSSTNVQQVLTKPRAINQIWYSTRETQNDLKINPLASNCARPNMTMPSLLSPKHLSPLRPMVKNQTSEVVPPPLKSPSPLVSKNLSPLSSLAKSENVPQHMKYQSSVVSRNCSPLAPTFKASDAVSPDLKSPNLLVSRNFSSPSRTVQITGVIPPHLKSQSQLETKNLHSPFSPVGHSSVSRENPDRDRNSCNCERSSKLVMCCGCGFATPGRLRIKCWVHPSKIFLMDLDSCSNCTSMNLQEIDVEN